MLQIAISTLLCGMLAYSIMSYIFLVGIEKTWSKFFWLKCGIISIGIAFTFLLFRDMTIPALNEFTAVLVKSATNEITYKTVIVLVACSFIGANAHKLSIKE